MVLQACRQHYAQLMDIHRQNTRSNSLFQKEDTLYYLTTHLVLIYVLMLVYNYQKHMHSKQHLPN